MIIQKQFLIDSSHPSLSAHFPGNPIVPGVVILGEILESIRQAVHEPFVIAHIPMVKLHSPLRPGEMVDLTIDLFPDQTISFSCQVNTRRIASGQFFIRSEHQSSPVSQ